MTGLRLVSVMGLVAAALLVPPSPAHAAVVTNYTAGKLTVTSDGASDAMVFTCSGSLRLNGATIPGVASCGVSEIEVRGNGGNDVIDVTAVQNNASTFDLDGGDGDDVIAGGEATNPANSNVIAVGGAGNDTLRFVNGDAITGGEGDDVFEVTNSLHSSTTLLQGQGGTDTYRMNLTGVPAIPLEVLPVSAGLVVSLGGNVTTSPWSSMEVVDALLTDGSETLHGEAFPGRLVIDGRGGNDALFGGDQGDVLKGGTGNDSVEGGDGADALDGGDGDDVLRSRDAYTDALVCGAGSDVAVLDAADSTNGCETRDLGSGTDGIKPKPTFSGAKVSGTKLKLRALCPATELRCVGAATLTAKGKRNGKATKVQLGDVLIVADGGRKDRLSLVLTPAQRAAVVGLTKAKLLIAYNVIDAGGNLGKGKASIRLKT